MELHTLGVNGGYTQADVTSLAHILTGWGLRKPGRERAVIGNGRRGRGFFRGWKPWRFGRRAPLPGSTSDPFGFYFDSSRHDFNDQTFLGRTYRGGDGIAEGEQALDVLAQSPATAHHLSFRLAQHFVADDPPQSLVGRMADKFERSRGDIRATLETLFFSPEFWDERYYGAKFKSPYEYIISAARLADTPDITNYRPLFGTMMLLGMAPYGRETPDGYPDVREAWLNPDAMMMRLSFATALGQGHLPLLASASDTGRGKPFRVTVKNGGGGAVMREISPTGDADPAGCGWACRQRSKWQRPLAGTSRSGRVQRSKRPQPSSARPW